MDKRFKVAISDVREEFHTIAGGRQMRTLQWTPFYVEEELDPDETHTAKWGDMRHARKWISFEDLQQWHPAFN